MVDIHSHILYGIDDGAKTLEDSINLLKQAKEVGIHHIIATPHYNDFIDDNFFELRDERCAELNDISRRKNFGIVIEVAVEVAFLSNWDKILTNNKCFINDMYILVEFPDHGMPKNSLEVIFQIRRKGLVPIIAHPERCIKIQNDMETVNELIRLGSHFQCDAGSLIGQFGANTRKTAEKLLKMDYYRFIGSDAHDPKYRNYSILAEIENRQNFENEKLESNAYIQEVRQNEKTYKQTNILMKSFSKFKSWVQQ